MIYKVTFHIFTLYIYQISSTQELLQENKKHWYMISFYFIYKKLPTHKMESKYCIMESINQDEQ